MHGRKRFCVAVKDYTYCTVHVIPFVLSVHVCPANVKMAGRADNFNGSS